MAVGVRNEGPGDAEHPRVAPEGATGKLWQLAVEARWQVLTDLTNLVFDKVVVIQEPLGCRGDRAFFADLSAAGGVGAVE